MSDMDDEDMYDDEEEDFGLVRIVNVLSMSFLIWVG